MAIYRIYLLSLGLAIFLQGCGDGICNPSDKYLVVMPFAGTSNRLRVLASAQIMAAITDRQLVVDWTLVKNETPGQWQELFRKPLVMFEQSILPMEGCTLSRIKSAEAGDAIIKNMGSQNNSDSPTTTLNQITEYPEPIIYFGTSMNFRPQEKYLSYSDYNERYRAFYQSLDPRGWITKEVKQFQKDHDFASKFMVGVHYRAWNTGRPDNYVINDPEARYLNEFIEEMKKATALDPAARNHKPVAFFLATDDPEVKKKMLAVPELAGTIVTRHDEIERSTVRGQQSALVDWFLLGSTNFIIGTYQSSFSDEAAHLTVQDRKIYIGKAAFK